METLSFTWHYDLPLLLAVAALLVWCFHYWSQNTELDSNADLAGRFPLASTKAIVLLALVCFACWTGNFPFWGIFAALLTLGLVVSIVLGGQVDGSLFGLFGLVVMLREWAFGFPSLILDPKNRVIDSSSSTSENSPLLGRTGVALSPLRPMGDIEIEGEVLSASSDNGQLIDTGTNVTVTCIRNGQPRVSPTA